MFIYRFFILYFTYNRHWGVYENYFFNQEISCRPKFHSHGIYIMYSSIHMHWYIYKSNSLPFLLCFNVQIYKWFESRNFHFYFILYSDLFVPSESIALYCCYYYYYCYYYLPYDDQSCEHFQHVVTSFAQNMKIGMGC